ncbi:unnamed protein product [Commensalibacter communis]|uniref:hypothetical protein n=1 Tax=Commensalibacter communis TaxID=2972786 RepID=UPI0022FF9A1F|nr:hypothetical protein [Commensalibacter communis]CAI3937899.1 unnamed protein product [Commensalibacter communis]CAI3939125.1 unnamed protein product [Commensalibacter communis]
MNSSFARFLKQFNRSFTAQLLRRWILIFTILTLCAWLFFLQYDFFRIPSKYWPANDENPGVLFTLFGFPAILVASFIVALLQTKKHRQKNFQRFYWVIYFVPALILLGIDFTCYHYYAYYLTNKDDIRREKLEQDLKTSNNPDLFFLAQMLEYGWVVIKMKHNPIYFITKFVSKAHHDIQALYLVKKLKITQKCLHYFKTAPSHTI